MKSLKFKKITNEYNNILGFDSIELLEREISYTYSYEIEGQKRIGYHYRVWAIADGSLISIDEEEFDCLLDYEIIRGGNS